MTPISVGKICFDHDLERSEQFIVDSLSICQPSDEWMAMLKAHPAAIGVTDESFISDDDFVLVCFDNPQTAVWVDALATGRMPSLDEPKILIKAAIWVRFSLIVVPQVSSRDLSWLGSLRKSHFLGKLG